jgi:hypothetical protein
MVVVPHGEVRPLPPWLDRLLWSVRRDQGVAASADQVSPAGLDDRVTDLEPVLRLEELHERPLQLAVPQVPGHSNRLAGHRTARRDIA